MDPDYQLLFRSVPGLYLVLTPDLVMVDASDARLHATMTRREDIVGHDLFEIFPDDPNDASATGVANLRASLDRVLRDRLPDVMAIQKYSLRRPSADGGDFERRFWSPVNVPVLGPDGDVLCIIHRVEDVTEFVRAIAELSPSASEPSDPAAECRRGSDRVAATVFRQAQDIQESNRQLRAANAALAVAHDEARATERRTREVLDSIGDAFFAVDEEWRFTYANRVLEVMWGIPRESLLGRRLLDAVPVLRGTELEEQLARVMRERVSVMYEARCVTLPGRWMNVRLFPAEHGASLYLKDITARQRATDAVRLLAEAGRVLSDSLDVDATLHAAAHLIAPGLAELCLIDVMDASGEIRRAVRLHADAEQAARVDTAESLSGSDSAPHPIAAQVIHSGKPLLVREVSDETLASLARGARRDERGDTSTLCSLIVVPLLARERVVGAMKLGITRGSRRFDDEDLALAEELGRRIGVALDNAALYRRADAAQRRALVLSSVAVASNEAPSSAAAFQSAVHAVCTTLHWSVGHAFYVDGTAIRPLAPRECWYDSDPQAHADFRAATASLQLNQQEGLPGRVLATRRPVWVQDLAAYPGFTRGDAAQRAGLRTGVAIPVLVGSEVRAVLELFSHEQQKEDADVLDALGQVGTQLGRVIEREEAAAARQKLVERLVLAQEEERRRISRELHDQVGQHLTALMLGVQALRKDCSSNPGALERLDRLEELADRVAAEARDLAVALRPTLLDDFGLASAIRAHVERWSADTRIPVILECSGLEEQRFPSAVETAVYRIVLEALTNVARHADASRINVILETVGEGITAIVEDDGGGFEPGADREAGRLGLVSMRERAALAGGSLVVESSPGEGTTVIARFPLAQREADEVTERGALP